MPIQSINPANNKVLKEYTFNTDTELENKLAQANDAFKIWRDTTFEYRAGLMMALADLLEKENYYYAQLATLEMGKPLKQAIGEVKKCAAVCRYYATKAAEFLQPEIIKTEAKKSYVSFEPLGAILAIMPWNFPYWQVFRFAAPAIMAGNVGILKHASNVPQCALALEEIFTKAGFPVGIFTTILVEPKKIESLIQDDRIKAVTLTGSEQAGSKVAEAAGRAIKKTVLELGGSDPFIILNDADVEKAAETAVNSRMINTGQSCIAAKRFIVEASVAEQFLRQMNALLASKKTGDPLNENIDYGPLARPDLAQGLQKQVDDSVAKGAKIYLAGGQENPESAYFKPMILTDVKPGMPAYEEELFGPVAVVFVVKDELEAIKIANDHRYGLGGTIFSQNIGRAEKVARHLETGNVFINTMMQSNPNMPFGGIKKSGYGRELSVVGIREFVNQKSIWVA